MRTGRILIIDDDHKMVEEISARLNLLGFCISHAFDGITGIEIAKRERPDLIILDIWMPGKSGYEVCQELKQNLDTVAIPIIILTINDTDEDITFGFRAGADDYVVKPFGMGALEARIRRRLQEAKGTPPFPLARDQCHLTLICENRERLIIRIDDLPEAFSQDALRIESRVQARRADNISRLGWSFNSKDTGQLLYHNIFMSHPEVVIKYQRALGSVGSEMRLHLRFGGSREFLRIPFETLFDGVNHFVLQHPLARYITDVQPRRPSINPTFLNDLWRGEKEELRVLLIASDTGRPIPGVDREIKCLGELLKRDFGSRGIKVEPRIVPTEKADYNSVRDLLRNCPYHILHYAGHGSHDEKDPDESALYFYEHPNRCGEIKKLPASELNLLIENSDLRFVYLSSCRGAQTADPDCLLDGDFLGVADAVIHAGVPTVLGFRWPVSDNGAELLALTFYKSLAAQGSIDRALLAARREVPRDRNDLTWLSPVLISQV